MTRALIYTRVSSDSSGHGRSVAEQEVECRKVCTAKGWTVAEVLVDNDRGASRHSRKQRPAFQELKDKLRPGDVLVTWAASRAARDLKAYVELRDLCAERGVTWSYSGTTYDMDSGEDRFRTGLDGLLAEREAEETRKNVLRSLAANAAEGKWHGKTVYGYRAIRDPNTGKIGERVPDETQAPIIREAAERVLKGETLRGIANDFTDRGVVTPHQTTWHGYTLRNMLMRPAYVGKRVHNGVVVQGNWEPILTEDEHVRLVALLTDPNRVRTLSRGNEPKYLLSGLAKCGVCEKPLYKAMSHRRPTLKCMNRPSHMSREMSKVEAVVLERILAQIEHYRVELVLRTADVDDDHRPVDPGLSDVADHLTEARELQQRLDAFYDQAAEGGLSPAALARIEARLLPKIAAATKAAESAARVSDPSARILDTPAEQLWESWTLDEQREFIRSAADIVVLPAEGRTFDRDRIQITMRKSLRTRPEGFEHYGS